jgi:hypothetical protein
MRATCLSVPLSHYDRDNLAFLFTFRYMTLPCYGDVWRDIANYQLLMSRFNFVFVLTASIEAWQYEGRPPLWSSGQSSWLQIQTSGFDSRRYHIFWEVMGLERGPFSLVSTTEELLEKTSSGSGLESREYGRRDPSRWPRGTLYPQKMTLTSPTSGGRSVGIVRSRTQTTELILRTLLWTDEGIRNGHIQCTLPTLVCMRRILLGTGSNSSFRISKTRLKMSLNIFNFYFLHPAAPPPPTHARTHTHNLYTSTEPISRHHKTNLRSQQVSCVLYFVHSMLTTCFGLYQKPSSGDTKQHKIFKKKLPYYCNGSVESILR